jgi:hypothetical protein
VAAQAAHAIMPPARCQSLTLAPHSGESYSRELRGQREAEFRATGRHGSARHCPALLAGPLSFGRFRPALLRCWAEAVLRTLGGDSSNGLPDLTPAGTLVSGSQGRVVTEAIRRASQKVGKSKEGERSLASFWAAGDEFEAALLEEGVDKGFGVSWHERIIRPGDGHFNYVLTTMC